MIETLLVYILIIALVAAVPEIIDIILAYRSRDENRKLIEKLNKKLKSNELPELIKAFEQPPPGIPGLTRGVMALTVIVILGVAIIHILVVGTPGDDGQIINTVLSMLAGLLAAITGFYFGGKAAVKETPKDIKNEKDTGKSENKKIKEKPSKS